MGKMSRDKGGRNERKFVNDHKLLGVDACRVPLSGAMKSHPGDVQMMGLTGEIKVRANGNGFKSLYDWIERDQAEFLAVRADHKPWLIVLPWDTWVKMMNDMGWTK